MFEVRSKMLELNLNRARRVVSRIKEFLVKRGVRESYEDELYTFLGWFFCEVYDQLLRDYGEDAIYWDPEYLRFLKGESEYYVVARIQRFEFVFKIPEKVAKSLEGLFKILFDPLPVFEIRYSGE